VVAGDRDRVEVPDVVVDEELLDVTHHAEREFGREDAGVLRLVFLQDVGLHRAAYAGERGGADLLVGLARQHLVAGDAEQHEAQAVVPRRRLALIARPGHAALRVEVGDRLFDRAGLPLARDPLLALLVDRRVQEEAEQHGRRSVDRHRHRGGRLAEIEPRVELLRVVDVGDRHAGVADLPVDVRPQVGVLAVERDRVEGGRQALRRQAV
jgi:hypothetical protein